MTQSTQREALVIAARDVVSLRDNFYRALSDIAGNIIDAAQSEPEPIKDEYIRIDSFTRSGIKHVVRVSNGKVRCSCEAATFKPENGPCPHVRSLRAMGKIDTRAEFDGGL